MESSLAKRIQIVSEALLRGERFSVRIGERIYIVGMSEEYDILTKMKKYVSSEEDVWVNMHMQTSLFFKIVEEMSEKEIQRLAALNASQKKR